MQQIYCVQDGKTQLCGALKFASLTSIVMSPNQFKNVYILIFHMWKG